MQMPILLLLLLFSALVPAPSIHAQDKPQEDVIPTSGGDLTISFIGHGTLMFTFEEKVIHIDPVGREADYSTLPDADLILITHEHGDHLDPAAVAEITKGDTETVAGFAIEAIPAYNIVNMRSEGMPYHPKGDGNGYLITFGELRVYVAGDTEDTPEMRALKEIDIAFLPMNLPYTMTPEMVADAARAFQPRILYPYHFGETDTNQLVTLLAGEEGIEVRVRDLG